MAALVCARCKTDVLQEDAKIDPTGRAYHAACYQIAYPDTKQSGGITITGVDIPFVDLTVFIMKLTVASLLVGAVLGMIWYLFRLTIPGR